MDPLEQAEAGAAKAMTRNVERRVLLNSELVAADIHLRTTSQKKKEAKGRLRSKQRPQSTTQEGKLPALFYSGMWMPFCTRGPLLHAEATTGRR